MVNVIPNLIFYIIGTFVGIFPIMIFFVITLETFSCLIYEIDEICTSKWNLSLLVYVIEMTKTLEKVKYVLSTNIFWAKTIISLQFLIMIYLFPVFFVNYARNEDPSAFLLADAGSMVLHGPYYCTLMWFFRLREVTSSDVTPSDVTSSEVRTLEVLTYGSYTFGLLHTSLH